MYNLLITYDDNQDYWENNQTYSMNINRILWRGWTDEHIRKRYQRNGNPDFDELKEFPCLFTYEGNDVIGAIGRIQSVRSKGNEVQLTYFLLDGCPKISINEDQVFNHLGITDKLERHTTHWAVKDVDLFQFTTKMLFERYDQGESRNLLSHGEMKKLWGDDYKRRKKIFLSHRAEYKKNVSKIKEQLEKEEISCFVAHDDIPPGSLWQDEIVKALSTMDIFIGFVTGEFHEGSWTDQEIGYAYNRDVPRIFVKLKRENPQGFVSTEQALKTTWDEAPQKIIKHLSEEI